MRYITVDITLVRLFPLPYRQHFVMYNYSFVIILIPKQSLGTRVVKVFYYLQNDFIFSAASDPPALHKIIKKM